MTVTEGLAIVLLSCTVGIVGGMLCIDIWELIVTIHLAMKARKEK